MKQNSPFWYKSGRFLWGTFLVGSIMITVATGPLLYKQYEVVQSKKERLAGMKETILQQKETVSLSSQPLRLPTNDELYLLQKRVPTDMDTPSFLKPIQEKATAAGVQWKGAQFASSAQELDQIIEKERSGEQLKEQSVEPKKEKVKKRKGLAAILGDKPLRSPYLKEMWVDLYVDADLAQLKNWLEQLKGLEQAVYIEGWDNQLIPKDQGNTRVRLSFLVYQDPELKIAPSQEELFVPQPSSELIQILPPSSNNNSTKEPHTPADSSGKEPNPSSNSPTTTEQNKEPTNPNNVTTPSS